MTGVDAPTGGGVTTSRSGTGREPSDGVAGVPLCGVEGSWPPPGRGDMGVSCPGVVEGCAQTEIEPNSPAAKIHHGANFASHRSAPGWVPA